MSRSLQKLRQFGSIRQYCSLSSLARGSRSHYPLFLCLPCAASQKTFRDGHPWRPSVFGRHFSKTPVNKAQEHQQNTKNDDRIKLFVNPEVQSLLKELTGRDLNRIFRKRKVEQKIREPKYSFMTQEQLIQARAEAEEKADQFLQMPPVLRPREPIDEILDFEPRLQTEDTSTLIFTDITMNVSDRDRIIVARDPDGTLRQASWEEREKMNAIYFPHPGRSFITPKMFTEPGALQKVLDRGSEEDNTYEFVLDHACYHFEPDDPLYISTVETTYDSVDRKAHYDLLKSTRHFGPMVFYLVRMRKMDAILLHSIQHGRVDTDVANLVTLFHIIFPECQSKTKASEDACELIKNYIQFDAIRKGELELALNAYVEERDRQVGLEEGLKRQHGLTS